MDLSDWKKGKNFSNSNETEMLQMKTVEIMPEKRKKKRKREKDLTQDFMLVKLGEWIFMIITHNGIIKFNSMSFSVKKLRNNQNKKKKNQHQHKKKTQIVMVDFHLLKELRA